MQTKARGVQGYPFSIPAGESRVFTTDFEFITNMLCDSDDLKININGEAQIIFKNNQTVPIRNDRSSTIEIFNSGSGTANLVVMAHDGGFDFNSSEFSGTVTVEVPTTFQTHSDPSVPSGAVTKILNTNTSRNEVILKNPTSNTSPFRIGDSSIGIYQGITLEVGQSMTINTTAEIYAFHGAGTAQSIQVAEII
jgi:hypothetical protein